MNIEKLHVGYIRKGCLLPELCKMKTLKVELRLVLRFDVGFFWFIFWLMRGGRIQVPL